MTTSKQATVSLADVWSRESTRPDQKGPSSPISTSEASTATQSASPTQSPSTSRRPSRAKQVLPQAGDVLDFDGRPNLNAVALVPPDLDGAVGSTGFHVLRARSAEPKYLYYAVQGRSFVDAMSLKVQGALYPAVRPRDIAAFEIPAIPQTEQLRVVEEIETQFTRLEVWNGCASSSSGQPQALPRGGAEGGVRGAAGSDRGGAGEG